MYNLTTLFLQYLYNYFWISLVLEPYVIQLVWMYIATFCKY